MTEPLLVTLYIFVLAVFVGFEVIAKVPTLLHIPLVSGSNAISGISVIGAILIAGRLGTPYAKILGVAAVAFGTINVVGGFLLTDRMLRMVGRSSTPSE